MTSTTILLRLNAPNHQKMLAFLLNEGSQRDRRARTAEKNIIAASYSYCSLISGARMIHYADMVIGNSPVFPGIFRLMLNTREPVLVCHTGNNLT